MKSSEAKILLIDDDPVVFWTAEHGLNGGCYQIKTNKYVDQAAQVINEFQPDVVLLNIRMLGSDGIKILKHIRNNNNGVSVVITSELLNSPLVIEAIQQGVEDFLSKPFDAKMLELCIYKVLEKKRMQQRLSHMETELTSKDVWDEFIGEGDQIAQIKKKIAQVALTDLNVLITGPSGTGKDIVARIIHNLSIRHNEPFIKVNCAALPKELLESELFGHEKGSFTGAHRSKPGRFELGEKGTVFLDEIGELPVSLQAKLLQVLEHKEFFRVGGTKATKVDIRLISATNEDIGRRAAEKRFRADLYYRLADVQIAIPALRERKDDIPLLINHFLLKYCSKYNKIFYPLSRPLIEQLITYDWPGNVRELESLIKRVVLFGEDEIVKHLSLNNFAPTGAAKSDITQVTPREEKVEGGLKSAVEETKSTIERHSILQALAKARWNRKKAAKALAISYRTLLYKIQRYKLGEEDNIDTQDLTGDSNNNHY